MRLIRSLGFASFVWVLAGCAAPTHRLAENPQAPVFVPITLLVNPGDKVSLNTANVLRHLQSRVVNSGMFARVDTGVGPSPVVLRLDYSQDCPFEVGEFAGLMVSAATLMLIPFTQTCVYSVRTRAYLGPELIDEQSHSINHRKVVGLFTGSHLDGDKQGADRLYEKLEQDFRMRRPLPALNPLQKKPDDVI